MLVTKTRIEEFNLSTIGRPYSTQFHCDFDFLFVAVVVVVLLLLLLLIADRVASSTMLLILFQNRQQHVIDKLEMQSMVHNVQLFSWFEEKELMVSRQSCARKKIAPAVKGPWKGKS